MTGRGWYVSLSPLPCTLSSSAGLRVGRGPLPHPGLLRPSQTCVSAVRGHPILGFLSGLIRAEFQEGSREGGVS